MTQFRLQSVLGLDPLGLLSHRYFLRLDRSGVENFAEGTRLVLGTAEVGGNIEYFSATLHFGGMEMFFFSGKCVAVRGVPA